MSNTDEIKLQSFFNTWKARKKSFDENYQFFAPQLSPHFNLFNLISPGEVKLSELIAFLLDPKGDHAQGALFLKEFLNILACEGIALPSLPDNGQARVECESRTDKIDSDRRRIDIKVSFGKEFGIGIENKLKGAIDQERQLEDYAEQLTKDYGQWCLIYLPKNKLISGKPDETSASPEQINKWEDAKQYVVLDYSDLNKWMKAAEVSCQSDRVRYFIRDFRAYCEQELRGGNEMLDASLIEKYVLDNDANLGLAIGISDQMDEIKSKLFEKLVNDLHGMLDGYEIRKVTQGDGTGKNGTEILCIKAGWKSFAFATQFEGKNYSELAWGLVRIGSTLPRDVKEVNLDLKMKFDNALDYKGEGTESNLYWPWWWYFETKRWGAEEWSAVLNGGMAETIAEKFRLLDEKCSSFIDEKEGLA